MNVNDYLSLIWRIYPFEETDRSQRGVESRNRGTLDEEICIY